MSEPTAAYTPGPDPAGPRFAPGELLAGRFRVVAPLGQGGMGEVYRADDLTLGQPVALKFLPAGVAADPDRLARFRKEVAAARGVSHPHVCRVYDLGDHAGQPFLAMEFVDGEDLASVLRRLGRVPAEKGVEIARQLAGALAAVHDRGLVHRDLKPANVMLDGRGRVRLTDFGLAAAAEELSADDVRSGTPAYMAPEQLAGQAVTARSDLFALGLVLFELFTGKRAFAATGRRELAAKYAAGLTSSPSSLSGGLDPVVERVIVRCLETDPTKRPGSAAEVQAALPGGDPLAAAVAAGEMPSPRLVADAGEVGLVRPWVGLLLLVAVAAGLVVCAVVSDRAALYRRIPLTESPAAMSAKARTVLAAAGYPDPPTDSFGWYWCYHQWFWRAAAASPDGHPPLSPDDPGVTFDYRQAARPFQLTAAMVGEAPTTVTATRPPVTEPEMAGVRLTPSGRLVELYAVPAADTPRGVTPLPEAVWRNLFAAAGLEFARYRPDTPALVPPVGCDERLAWSEAAPGPTGRAMRVEAARCGDRPVFFKVTDGAIDALPPDNSTLSDGVFITVLLLAGGLAARNWVRGRADTRTAARMVFVYGAGTITIWVVAGHHPGFGLRLIDQLPAVFGSAAYVGWLIGMFYLALEPMVRRRWPWQLTGWQRLFDGRVRDPLVGRDVLVGAAAGVWTAVMEQASHLGQPSFRTDYLATPPILTGDNAAFSVLRSGLVLSPLLLVFACLLFLMVRREWAAWTGVVVLLSLMAVASATTPLVAVPGVIKFVSLVAVVARYGMLAGVGLGVGFIGPLDSPVTADPAAWYFPRGAGFTLGLLAVCGYCCWTATGAKRLFREGFFGDD